MSSRRASVSEAANAIATQMTGRPEREVERRPIAQIRRDGGTQPRAGLDPAVVAEYVEVLEHGGALPPVEVVYDGTDYWLWDGYHRLAAAEQVGETEFDVYVTSGTRRDAVLKSVGANADHGLRRTNEDKRRAVETLLNDAEWSTWSDREIARTCKVSHTFVANMRSELTGNGCQSEDGAEGELTVRRGADGRTIDVSNIQTANQLRAAREALAKLDLPALDEAWRDTIKRALYSGEDHLERETFSLGSRLRAYLPYALQIELDSDEPRLSFVNWLRGELAAWQEEQERPAAIEQEKADRWARGTHFEQRKPEEREAILANMRRTILEALQTGPMRAIELRAALGDPATEPFRLAREQLKSEGLLIEEIPAGGRPTYRLAPGVSANNLPKQNVPEEPPDLWLDRERARASEPHSDDHDEALDAAYRTMAVFGQAVMHADEAIRKLFEIRGIRALYALPPERMKQVYGDVSDLRYLAEELATYCDGQLKKLRLMSRTGQPYDAEEDEA